jgi:uncharacterized protein DUF2278
MAHHHHERHQHQQRQLKQPPATGGHVPSGRYGALVGVLDGPLSDADDNHVFIFVRIPDGQFAGRYKLAFNVESDDRHTRTQFALRDEAISADEVPPEEFDDTARLSYAGLGLHQADFKPINNGNLRTIVHSTLAASFLVSAYGFTFPGGMHEIHMNSGERPGDHHPDRPNRDGALACYYRTGGGDVVRRWVFIKFDSQDLP